MTQRILIGLAALAALFLRLYQITRHEFLFYDEGMYLGYNHAFLNLVAQNPPHSLQEFFIITGLMFKNALSTAKALWFFMLNLRVFIVGPEGYYIARMISTFAGLATVALSYVWAKRYFDSKAIAILTAFILLVLPSHVFYSRLGMQESLSTFLFLAGFYCYYFSKRGISIGLLGSALLMSAVYFTNYRMIISPIFIIAAQVFIDMLRRDKIDFIKMFWFNIIFFAIILGIGSLYGGVNNYVNFGWMTHQAGEAALHRQWLNFFSFPYYIFKLDNLILGLFFFSGFYLVVKRKFECLLPFLLVIIQMFLFSFAAEKGARYLCVVLPFLAMAVAYQINALKLEFMKFNMTILSLVIAMFFGLLFNSILICISRTDYDKAITFILKKDPGAKIISTQPIIESLFVTDEKSIVAFPKDPQQFALLLNQGYRYVILDPQAYISWTVDDKRFSSVLIPPLELMQKQLKPIAVFNHIQDGYLERFVLDHNQDLLQSLEFLKNSAGKGRIYIYDLKS